MEQHRAAVIRKYRFIARLPDFLFGFTFPLRRRTVERLGLAPSASVLEVGCSTGANFNLLEQVVGSKGKIIGVDLSPEMMAQARKRVFKAGWPNIRLIEGAAEEVELTEQVDGLLLFAMHDVLVSPRALDNILRCLKPGGRVVAAGPKLTTARLGTFLNPFIRLVFRRFAVSDQDKDRPWRLLEQHIRHLQIEEAGLGTIYLVWGTAETTRAFAPENQDTDRSP